LFFYLAEQGPLETLKRAESSLLKEKGTQPKTNSRRVKSTITNAAHRVTTTTAASKGMSASAAQGVATV
jgi:hypothetical protein